ncbi:hypothetical protein PAXRUDRAFT_834592 [Paxillus rubicundulus Ve08.2h10]|uniref:Uncharacterized protein n=1 Tax=Paxillus rubicundulus Ve08.2h10 TaxID=930991 RepID=A0A0D0DCG4_9AGAM|nr:hypothetical protein PAXRUDRAFT_834592 [Paxillus rubicundulus Ve08.2h10]
MCTASDLLNNHRFVQVGGRLGAVLQVLPVKRHNPIMVKLASKGFVVVNLGSAAPLLPFQICLRRGDERPCQIT